MIRGRRRALSFALLPSLLGCAAACSPSAPQPVTAPVSTSETPAPTAPTAPTPAPATSDGGATGASSADASARRVQTLFVREAYADCEGEGPRKCLQVRPSESAPWELFYASIEGFTYEESNAYELRVEVLPDPRPRADASSLRYRLVEVVSKRKVPASSKKP